ncbi:MAG: DUF4352 domain-containing protein [Streptosporangiaceae bacterium]
MTYDQPPGGQPWLQQGQPYNTYPPPGYPQQPQYPPPGYQQPGYPPQQQYPPGYPPPGGPRKSWPRRHPILTTVLGLFGFFVVIGVIAGIAGGAGHTVTTGQVGSTPSATSSSTASASSSASSTAKVGSTITLTGNSSGEKMDVTVTRVISHAQPADQFFTPDPGKRFYAVQFRLADTGTAAYSDSPSNGAAAVDAAGQSYQATIGDVAGCESFPGTENIAAGDKGLGCIVFQVPDGAKITKVQFTLDSGFGPDTGQWDVRG